MNPKKILSITRLNKKKSSRCAICEETIKIGELVALIGTSASRFGMYKRYVHINHLEQEINEALSQI